MTASKSFPESWLVVATDGSCLRNPGGPSGWAWYADDANWAAGGMTVGTNQQAELTAVLAALRGIPAGLALRIETDSDYTFKACTKWISSWKKRGWRKSDGSPVANLELMQDLDLAMQARTAPFEIVWVRGHDGHPGNENADQRAVAASRAVAGKKAIPTGPGWTGVPAAPAAPERTAAERPGKQPEDPEPADVPAPVGMGDDAFALPAKPKPSRRGTGAKAVPLPLDGLDFGGPAPAPKRSPKTVPLMGGEGTPTRLKSTLPTCPTCKQKINPFSGGCGCPR